MAIGRKGISRPIYRLREHGDKFVRVFSRHDSHNFLRFNLPIENGKYTVYRAGSLTAAPGAEIEINTVESINNCANKIKMKSLFHRAGVSTPDYYTIDPETISILDASGEPVTKFKYPLIAKRNKRSGGAGMIKIDNAQEFEEFLESKVRVNNYNKTNPYYLEKFKNYSREYRIHLSAAGHYFYANRKLLTTDAQERWYRNDSNSIWATEENIDFNKPATWNDIVADCQKAREALGLDICGFDVRVNKEGKWVIIEANSACSFGNNPNESITAIKYKKELLKVQKLKS